MHKSGTPNRHLYIHSEDQSRHAQQNLNKILKNLR